MPRVPTIVSAELSAEHTITTTIRTTFKPKDKFEDLQEAVRKLKSTDEKTSKQASSEYEMFPTLGELLHIQAKYESNYKAILY